MFSRKYISRKYSVLWMIAALALAFVLMVANAPRVGAAEVEKSAAEKNMPPVILQATSTPKMKEQIIDGGGRIQTMYETRICR
jgi:hypothetical protein